MSNQFVGEIRMFAGKYAPEGWAFCNGALLDMSSFNVLFSVIGNTYGGDGSTTFALPDLRGRAAMGAGQAPGLSPRRLGQSGGTETVALTLSHMPAHNHDFMAVNASATSPSPVNARPGIVAEAGLIRGGYSLDKDAPLLPLNDKFLGSAFGSNGAAEPHNNMMPSMVTNYIIAVGGVYPPSP